VVLIFGVVAHALDLMVPEAIRKSWSLWGSWTSETSTEAVHDSSLASCCEQMIFYYTLKPVSLGVQLPPLSYS